ncbi:DOF zinc finger protein DOF1.7-like protein [Tanacetum coccineum]
MTKVLYPDKDSGPKLYWTKGGTLRNIPVGGATRKITKPKPKKQHVVTSSTSTSAPVQNNNPQVEMKVEHDQHVHVHGHEEVFNGFGSLLMGVGPMGGFGSLLMDGLGDGGDVASEEVLIRNPNVGENGGAAGGDEMNGWPELSIFTPGSSFR